MAANKCFVVDLDTLRNNPSINVTEMLDKLDNTGLTAFVAADGLIFEEALEEFYENSKLEGETITSKVKGEKIAITSKLVTETFKLPTKGLSDFSSGTISKKAKQSAWEVISMDKERLYVPFKKMQLTPQYRLLADIIAKVVECRGGAFDAVTKLRYAIMTAIISGIAVNWAEVIYGWFKEAVKNAKSRMYGVHLSILLRKMVRNLDEKDGASLPSVRYISAASLKRSHKMYGLNKVKEEEDWESEMQRTSEKNTIGARTKEAIQNEAAGKVTESHKEADADKEGDVEKESTDERRAAFRTLLKEIATQKKQDRASTSFPPPGFTNKQNASVTPSKRSAEPYSMSTKSKRAKGMSVPENQHGPNFVLVEENIDELGPNPPYEYDADHLSEDALKSQFASYHSKTSTLVENLFEQLKEQGEEIRKLKDQKEESDTKLANLQTEYEALDQAYEKGKLQFYKNFHNTKEGKAILNDNWQSKKAEFLKSLEFRKCWMEKAVIYYSHGFWSCEKQFVARGYPPPGTSREFLDEDAGLDDVPDPDDNEA